MDAKVQSHYNLVIGSERVLDPSDVESSESSSTADRQAPIPQVLQSSIYQNKRWVLLA